MSHNNYPIPGCTAFVLFPDDVDRDATVTVDGDLTLDHLRWLVAELERREKHSGENGDY